MYVSRSLITFNFCAFSVSCFFSDLDHETDLVEPPDIRNCTYCLCVTHPWYSSKNDERVTDCFSNR